MRQKFVTAVLVASLPAVLGGAAAGALAGANSPRGVRAPHPPLSASPKKKHNKPRDKHVDPKKAEALIRQGFAQAEIQPDSVKCPSGVKVKEGTTFDCKISFPDGRSGTVTLHITSNTGKAKFDANDVHVK